MTLHHDFETRSIVDLEAVGLDNYTAHATTQALMLSWALHDGPVQLWQAHLHGPEIPEEVRAMILDPSVVKSSWNTAFERCVWRRLFAIESPAEQWEDPMVQARYLSLPGKLELAGPIGGLPADRTKLQEGRQVVQMFSMPIAVGRNKGKFNDWSTHPQEWAKFCQYCCQDTEAERAFYKRFMQ